MAGQHRPQPLRHRDRRRLVLGAEALLQIGQAADVVGERLVRHAVLALHVFRQLGDVAELALAGGVVHQADQLDPVARVELVQLGHQRLRTDLGAQVDVVADPKRVGRDHGQDFRREGAGVAGVFGLVLLNRADAQRVEHRGDADARQFRVMGHDGRGVRPAHARAGLDVAFQVVGVQFDHPRRDEVAAAVDRAGRCRAAFVQIGDQPVPDDEAAVGDPVAQDQ